MTRHTPTVVAAPTHAQGRKLGCTNTRAPDTALADALEPPCGETMLASWLQSDTAKVDTSCVAEVAPPPFAKQVAYDMFLFGQPDAWDATSTATPYVIGSEAIRAELEAMLRRRPRTSVHR